MPCFKYIFFGEIWFAGKNYAENFDTISRFYFVSFVFSSRIWGSYTLFCYFCQSQMKNVSKHHSYIPEVQFWWIGVDLVCVVKVCGNECYYRILKYKYVKEHVFASHIQKMCFGNNKLTSANTCVSIYVGLTRRTWRLNIEAETEFYGVRR